MKTTTAPKEKHGEEKKESYKLKDNKRSHAMSLVAIFIPSFLVPSSEKFTRDEN
jgi:hypothetical protein